MRNRDFGTLTLYKCYKKNMLEKFGRVKPAGKWKSIDINCSVADFLGVNGCYAELLMGLRIIAHYM